MPYHINNENSITLTNIANHKKIDLYLGSKANKILTKLNAADSSQKNPVVVFKAKADINFQFIKALSIKTKKISEGKNHYLIVSGRKNVLKLLDELEQNHLKTKITEFETIRSEIVKEFVKSRPIKSRNIDRYELSTTIDYQSHSIKLATKKGKGTRGFFKENKKGQKITEIEAAIGAIYRLLLVSHTPKVTALYSDTEYRGVYSKEIKDYVPLRKKSREAINELIKQGLIRILVAAYLLEEDDLHLTNIGFDARGKLYKIDHDRSLWGISAKYHGHDPDKPYRSRPAPNQTISITKKDILSFPELNKAEPSRWPPDLNLLPIDPSPQLDKEKYKWFLNAILLDQQLISVHVEAHLGDKKKQAEVIERLRQRFKKTEEILLDLPEFQDTVLNNPQFVNEFTAEFNELNTDFKNDKYKHLRIDTDKIKTNYASIIAKLKFNKAERFYQNTPAANITSIDTLWYEAINSALLAALKGDESLIKTFKEKILTRENHPAKNYLLVNLHYFGITELQHINQENNYFKQMTNTAYTAQLQLLSQLYVENPADFKINFETLSAFIYEMLNQADIDSAIKYFQLIKTDPKNKNIINPTYEKINTFIANHQIIPIDDKKHHPDFWLQLTQFYQAFYPDRKNEINYCLVQGALAGNENCIGQLQNSKEPLENIYIEKQVLKNFLTKLQSWKIDAHLMLEQYRTITQTANPIKKFWQSNYIKCKNSLETQLIYAHDLEFKLMNSLKKGEWREWRDLIIATNDKLNALEKPENLNLDLGQFQSFCLTNLDQIKTLIFPSNSKSNIQTMELAL